MKARIENSAEIKARIENSALTLLTARQVASALGISMRKLWSLTNSKEIVSIRIGRAIRYDAEDLRAFVDAARTVAK